MKRCCLKSLDEETDRRDLSQKFKPVWIRRTSRMDQILVRTTRFCGKKMDNSHDGTCPHGLVAGTRVPTFMFLWQAAIFRQAFFQSSIFFYVIESTSLFARFRWIARYLAASLPRGLYMHSEYHKMLQRTKALKMKEGKSFDDSFP